ncbi:MAG TPA: MMPL family transporter [Trebonia sp.]|nr:MMPL family transporter [Trebonia sp.]
MTEKHAVTVAPPRDRQAAVAALASPLGRLGAWSCRHRRAVLLGWLLVLVLVSLAGQAAGSRFKNDFNGGSTPSAQAQAFLARQFPAQAGDSAQVVFATSGPVTAPASQARIAQTVGRLQHLAGVVSVRSPFAPGAAGQISSDRRLAYATVQFGQASDLIPDADIRAVVTQAQDMARPGFNVQLGGAPVEKVEKPAFGASEGLGILAAVVILLLAFGSVIAMLLPVASAVAGVAVTFGAVDLISHALTVPTFAPELAALVGLGVGIDYALFVVTRYRSALHAGSPPETAVTVAMATSGLAVLFAGSTVVLSLLGLFLLGLPFIYGAALAAVIAVLVVMTASMTLLPAALGFAGGGIDRFAVRRSGRPAGTGPALWARWSRQIQRRPWASAAAALLVLAALAVPFFSLRLAYSDAGDDPAGYTTRQAYDLLAAGFGAGANGPLVIAVKVPDGAGQAVAGALAARLAAEPDVAAASAPRFDRAGDAAVISVIPDTAPQDARTTALVQRIRGDVIPAVTRGTRVTALVGGVTAASIDSAEVTAGRLPLVIGVVVALSLLLLTAAFRSVLIPVTSALMTLISTGAAYGVTVTVFQWGWLGPGIDNGRTAPLDPWVPLFLFALLFGLSMDYQVFLLSRIREGWKRTGDNTAAVAGGLASTGRIITSAAAIMICVFGSFVLGDLRVLRLFGLGMAAAVLLDATLVRMVLVPSVMEILGRANWWMPRWLDRAVPPLAVEVEAGGEAV